MQGSSGYRDHAVKYVAYRYNKAKSDIFRTEINPSCVHRGLRDSETCVTVSLQDGREISTTYFSAWKTDKMQRLDGLLLIKLITEPGNEPTVSKL